MMDVLRRNGGHWVVKGIVLAVVIVVAGVALAGCTGKQEKASIKVKEKASIKVKVFWKPEWGARAFDILEVADAKGFFKSEGLEVERLNLPDDQYNVALDSGRIDFAPAADYAYFANVRATGINAKEVVSSTVNINELNAEGFFVLSSSPIKKAEDLKGKKIGVTPWGSDKWYVFDYLQRKGITKDEVTLVTIPPLQYEQVLRDGRVDGVYQYQSQASEWVKKGGFRRIFSLYDVAGGRRSIGGTMVNLDFAKKNPEVVRGFVAAIAKAADWANENPAEVVKISVGRGNVDAELAPYVYGKSDEDYSKLRWTDHALISEEDIKFWLELVERQGVIEKGKLKAVDLFTNEFNPYSKQ